MNNITLNANGVTYNITINTINLNVYKYKIYCKSYCLNNPWIEGSYRIEE